MFAKDTPDKSNCSAGCLKAWPALMSQGAPTLGTGVDASMIGTADLADGTKVVTYNHMPLYYYAKDTKAGDVVGQGVGSVWFVVSPDGKPVGMTSPSTSPTVQATASGASSGSSSSAAAMINVVADPKLGNILVGANGMTLYMFAKDTPDKSNCSAACLVSWPPLVSTGQPTLGTGVNASMVGSATLADGRTIVTYNHMPLYYFAKDQKAGDVTGQGVGSVWFVVSPDGKPVGQ
jgi:predicted lipoprotein with Yx(FWY)xxD motif